MGASIGARKRAKAAELFNQGYGYKAVSSELGINRETVREWACTWRALGEEGLLKSPHSHKHYDKETKQAAINDRLNGVSVIAVMERYGINNRNCIKRWMQEYRDKHER